MKKKLSNHVVVRTGNLIVAGVLLAILSSTTSLAQETGKEAAKDKAAATETTAAAEKTAATEAPVAQAKTGTKGKQAAKEKDVVQEPVWSDYQVILDRNMFSKLRQEPFDPTKERPVTKVTPADPESFYILRGITNENGMFRACLQDNKQGGVLWVVAGDPVARGKIKTIPSLDSIEFEMGETSRTIQMGFDLAGGRGKIDVRDVPSMMGGGARPDRGGDMRFGGGNMRMNDMRSRSQSGFDTGFGRRGGGRDRMNMGGMGMGMGMDMQPQTSSTTSSSSSDTTLSGSDAEILRRMMERRAAEMGQAVPASDPNQQQPGQ